MDCGNSQRVENGSISIGVDVTVHVSYTDIIEGITNDVTSHHIIISQHITSHHVTSHHITSHHITSYCIRTLQVSLVRARTSSSCYRNTPPTCPSARRCVGPYETWRKRVCVNEALFQSHHSAHSDWFYC